MSRVLCVLVKADRSGKAVGVRCWLVWMILLLAPVKAQEIFELPLPEKPADQVLDQVRLFVVDPERRDAMAAKVQDFTRRTGYEVQVVFFDNLIGTELPEQANRLQEAWLGHGPGLVLVVVTDSGEWKIAWASTPDVVTEEGGKVPVLGKRDVAPQEKIDTLQVLVDLPKMSAGSVEGAELLVDTLLANLELSFIEEQPKTNHRLRFWVLGIGLLAALVLLAVLTVTLIRRSDAKARDQLVLPDVPVGQRLGAPHGGGKISVSTFRQAPDVGP